MSDSNLQRVNPKDLGVYWTGPTSFELLYRLVPEFHSPGMGLFTQDDSKFLNIVSIYHGSSGRHGFHPEQLMFAVRVRTTGPVRVNAGRPQARHERYDVPFMEYLEPADFTRPLKVAFSRSLKDGMKSLELALRVLHSHGSVSIYFSDLNDVRFPKHVRCRDNLVSLIRGETGG